MRYITITLFLLLMLIPATYGADWAKCKIKRAGGDNAGRLRIKLISCDKEAYNNKWFQLSIKQSEVGKDVVTFAIANSAVVKVGVLEKKIGSYRTLDALYVDTFHTSGDPEPAPAPAAADTGGNRLPSCGQLLIEKHGTHLGLCDANDINRCKAGAIYQNQTYDCKTCCMAK